MDGFEISKAHCCYCVVYFWAYPQTAEEHKYGSPVSSRRDILELGRGFTPNLQPEISKYEQIVRDGAVLGQASGNHYDMLDRLRHIQML